MNLINKFFKASLNPSLINGFKRIAYTPCQTFFLSFHSNAKMNENNTMNSGLIAHKLQIFNLCQKREYKQKVRLRKRCKSCYFVWRCGRLYVECKEHPRHKQHHCTSMLKGFDSVAHGYDKNSPINHLY